MPPQRRYADGAARQAAYRARKRQAQERLSVGVEKMQEACEAAAGLCDHFGMPARTYQELTQSLRRIKAELESPRRGPWGR